MLSLSSTSDAIELKNIVQSTAGIIFLGTPHRGSADLSAMGEWVRVVLSGLRMETTSAILDTLGLKTADLERAQESFSNLWRKYDFRVKTFQEGLGLTGIKLGVLGNKVVPDYSSLIGDHRERAETLQANHLEMCRFTGNDDPNFIRVIGELQLMYASILTAANNNPLNGPGMNLKSSNGFTDPELDDNGKACLNSLWFPRMNDRHWAIQEPAGNTGSWLTKCPIYQKWFNQECSPWNDQSFLWLKGKPGAGKSVLMKEAFRRAKMAGSKSGVCTAAFFFNAKGEKLERTPTGMFQSLLYQLLPRYRTYLPRFLKIWEQKELISEYHSSKKWQWKAEELKHHFKDMIMSQPTTRAVIFIDALDECLPESIRSLADYWQRLTDNAASRDVHLKVCMSSRHFPEVSVRRCPLIKVEERNAMDISTYVDQQLKSTVGASEPEWENTLKQKILDRSAGVFLWVVLVIDAILKAWDEGKGLSWMLLQVDQIPEDLEQLFTQMFRNLDPDAKRQAMKVFQWALLAVRPLRLHEWHHILGFIESPVPSSLHQWRISENFTSSDEQLEKRIISLTRGLLEVSKKPIVEDPSGFGVETMSVWAGAGSMDFEHGETRVVQVIHESVRDFFLKGQGFTKLNFDAPPINGPIAAGHLSIMYTCLDYVNIKELDALVQARGRTAGCKPFSSPPQSSSEDEESSDSDDSIKFRAGYRRQPRDIRSLPEGYSDMAYRAARTDLHGELRTVSHRFENITRQQTKPNFEELRRLFPESVDAGVAHWIGSTQEPSIYPSIHGSTKSSTRALSAAQSKVLEDYPALLFYVTGELFTHAKLAKAAGADLAPFFDQLSKGKAWPRWVALREDLLPGTGPVEGDSNWEAKHVQALLRHFRRELEVDRKAQEEKKADEQEQAYEFWESRIRQAEGVSEMDGNLQNKNETVKAEKFSGRGEYYIHVPKASSHHSREDGRYEAYKPRRRRSVASFGSAGSYN